jgi:hypothetical protein
MTMRMPSAFLAGEGDETTKTTKYTKKAGRTSGERESARAMVGRGAGMTVAKADWQEN